MPKVRWLLLAFTLAVAPVLTWPTGLSAQDYPNRPIRVIIPFAPGGSNDVVGRMITTRLGDRLGKQMYVENRGGAGGVIGTEAASTMAPDGYTLLVISIAHAINPWLYKLSYDPIKAFSPVALLATGTNVLVANPDFPVHSVKDLIALAKSKPGEIPYASAGIGSFQHLGAELFKLDAGVDLLHVPFKGGGPAMVDVMAGNTKVMFSALVQTTPLIASGKLRALATGGAARSPALPDVPTIAEAGVPNYEALNWWGIVAPAGTPQPIIDKLNAAIAAVQDDPAVQQQFAAQGAEVAKMAPAEFGAFMAKEMNKWESVVKKSGIKAM